MKWLIPILFIGILTGFRLPNATVEKVDLNQYVGTWYSLYSIPSTYDKGSRETTGKYTWNKNGYYDVITSYKNREARKCTPLLPRFIRCREQIMRR